MKRASITFNIYYSDEAEQDVQDMKQAILSGEFQREMKNNQTGVHKCTATIQITPEP
jgi:hypothetical protein